MKNYFVRTPSDVLWEELLKNSKLGDFKFSRDIPLNTYVMDFYCDEKRIAILLSGSRSKVDNALLKRSLWLKGILVIMITDIEILNNIREVEKNLKQNLSKVNKA